MTISASSRTSWAISRDGGTTWISFPKSPNTYEVAPMQDFIQLIDGEEFICQFWTVQLQWDAIPSLLFRQLVGMYDVTSQSVLLNYLGSSFHSNPHWYTGAASFSDPPTWDTIVGDIYQGVTVTFTKTEWYIPGLAVIGDDGSGGGGIGAAPVLSGTITANSHSSIDLQTLAELSISGTVMDWLKWESPTSSIVQINDGHRLLNYYVIGDSSTLTTGTATNVLSWTKGTPTPSGSDGNGIQISGLNNGFSFYCDSDSLPKHLLIFLNIQNVTVSFSITISDSSNSPIALTQDNNSSTNLPYILDINFSSFAGANTIRVEATITTDHGSGFLMFGGAALHT